MRDFVNSEISKDFSVRSGLRPSCVASPLLCNIVINTVMQKGFANQCGVKYEQDKLIRDMSDFCRQ